MRIHTIHHFGISFGFGDNISEHLDIESDSIVYEGLIDKMPQKVAKKVAEIHPLYGKYYEMAMMPLYKTYGKKKSGTESPKYSIATLRGKKEAECDYIVIWNVFSKD